NSPGNCPRRDSTNGFARRCAAAALPVSNSIFRLISVIGVRRPEFARDLAVILRSSIFVADKNCYGSSERFPFKHPRKNFASVCLFALRSQPTLAWPAAV